MAIRDLASNILLRNFLVLQREECNENPLRFDAYFLKLSGIVKKVLSEKGGQKGGQEILAVLNSHSFMA